MTRNAFEGDIARDDITSPDIVLPMRPPWPVASCDATPFLEGLSDVGERG